MTKISLTGLLLGFSLLASCGGAQNLQGKFSAPVKSSLDSPKVSVSLASSPVSQTVSIDTEDVQFLGIKFQCISSKDCTVNKVKLNGYLDDNGGSDSFQSNSSLTDHGNKVGDFVSNITLRDSAGTVYMGPLDPEADGSVTFTDSFAVPANGLVTLTVIGDISEDAVMNDDPESLAFAITSGTNVKISNGVVSGKVNTDMAVNIETSETLEASLASSPVSKSVAPDSDNEELLGFNLECKSYSDCNVTQIQFNTSLSSSTASYIKDLELWEDKGGVVSGPVDIDSRLQADFSDDFTVSAGSSKKYLIKGDVDASANGDIYLYFNECEVDSMGNLEAYNDNGNIGCSFNTDVNQDGMVVITVK